MALGASPAAAAARASAAFARAALALPIAASIRKHGEDFSQLTPATWHRGMTRVTVGWSGEGAVLTRGTGA